MAKKSSIENNNRRMRLAQRYKDKRAALKAIAADEAKSVEERFLARVAEAGCEADAVSCRAGSQRRTKRVLP